MQAEFNVILSELGQLIGCELTLGANGACLIRLESECMVQLEWDDSLGRLNLFAKLGPLVGNSNIKRSLLLSALKANGEDNRDEFILTFSDLHKELMLYQTIAVDQLDVVQLADAIARFGKEALIWIDALRNGLAPQEFAVDGGGPHLFEALRWKS